MRFRRIAEADHVRDEILALAPGVGNACSAPDDLCGYAARVHSGQLPRQA
jgi:hypothetical protein